MFMLVPDSTSSYTATIGVTIGLVHGLSTLRFPNRIKPGFGFLAG